MIATFARFGLRLAFSLLRASSRNPLAIIEIQLCESTPRSIISLSKLTERFVEGIIAALKPEIGAKHAGENSDHST